MKNRYIIITIICIAVCTSYFLGVRHGRDDLIRKQAALIQSEYNLKQSLANQVEYIKNINNSFGKTADMALKDWLDKIEVAEGEK